MVPEYINSIISFLDKISYCLNKYSIIPSKTFEFKRYFIFNGEKIPLGKIIIDEVNSKIFIYESFYRDGTICSPDITVIDFKNLKQCKLVLEDFNTCLLIDGIDNEENYLPISITFESIGSMTLLFSIYTSINKLVRTDSLLNRIRSKFNWYTFFRHEKKS